MPGTSTTSPPANASPISSKNGRDASQRRAERAVAQLDHVAEQDEPVDVGDVASSSRSRIGARRSTSLREEAPRWRSEMSAVVAIGANPRNSGGRVDAVAQRE